MPAAFGRLCVETIMPSINGIGIGTQPPSGGCVLKPNYGDMTTLPDRTSRLRAAVC